MTKADGVPLEAQPTVTVPAAYLTAALDEIWALRQLCGYEAAAREADTSHAAFSRDRIASSEAMVRKLRQASRGEAELAIADVRRSRVKSALRMAGADQSLTRSSW